MPDSNKSLKLIVVILSLLLVGSSLLLYGQIKLQDETISTLVITSEKQKATIDQLELNIAQLKQNLSLTETQCHNKEWQGQPLP
ncbi:MAG: hypothetical protein O8C58_06685 [Candidatus Methanoperedens sp.]|nr:hypothetical protein [Candidatus Methanoperedens sp.]